MVDKSSESAAKTLRGSCKDPEKRQQEAGEKPGGYMQRHQDEEGGPVNVEV